MTSSPKIAIVGLGYWGPNLLRNLSAAVGAAQVVAVDSSLDRLAAVATSYPASSLATSLEQALGEHDLQGVVVATPVRTHHRLAKAALEAGCHVLVEKPLAGSAEEAAELKELGEALGRTVMVGHTFLFSPRVELMRSYVRDGVLGTIQYATSSRLNLGRYQGDVSVIWDLAPHDFSILFRVLGESPVAVQTSGRATKRRDLLDVAFVSLRFPSGVVAAVNVSWLSPSKVRDTVVVGDDKMLVYNDIDNEAPLRLYDKGVDAAEPENFGEHQLTYRHGDVLVPYVAPREPLAVEIEHFVACVAGNAVCESDASFGLQVVQALEAAERSWREGGEVVPVDGRRAGALV